MNRRDAISQPKSQRAFGSPPTSESRRLRAAIVAPTNAAREFLTRIPMRIPGGLLFIPTSQIVMIVAHGERLTITTSDSAEYSLDYRLKNLEARLNPAEFLRLSRGTIVKLSAISRILRGSSGTNKVILENGQELNMSRIQAARLGRVLLAVLR